MFSKTTDSLKQVQDELAQVKTLLEQKHLEAESKQDQQFQKVHDSFHQVHEKQFYYFDEFEKHMQVLRDLNLQFKKEFEQFSSFKQHLEQKMIERVEKELREQLQKHVEKLKGETDQLKGLQQDITQLREEVQRLQGMSQKVKDVDLQLPNYAKTLAVQEQDKLKLSREIDHLQDLIAKMRQGRHS